MKDDCKLVWDRKVKVYSIGSCLRDPEDDFFGIDNIDSSKQRLASRSLLHRRSFSLYSERDRMYSLFSADGCTDDFAESIGNSFFIWLRSKGSANIRKGGGISWIWMIYKSSVGFWQSITWKYKPGGRRISSSFSKDECARISFPLVLSIENNVLGPDLPK